MAALEHLRPRPHPLQHFLLDLPVGVAVGCEAQQCIGEGLRGKLSVKFGAAVLAQRIGELEGVQLDVGISVCETLDQGRHSLRRTGRRGGDPVANI